jgi:hypothetical protein
MNTTHAYWFFPLVICERCKRVETRKQVKSSQNHGVFALFPSFGIENTTFRKLDLFQYSGEMGRRHILIWAS